MWILIIVLSTYDGVVTDSVPGFTSKTACLLAAVEYHNLAAQTFIARREPHSVRELCVSADREAA